MRLMAKLAWRHIKANRRRTVFTLTGIILSVAMLTAVNGFVVSSKDALYTMRIQGRGDYHVAITNLTAEAAMAVQANDKIGSSFIKTDDHGVATVYFRLENPAEPNGGFLELGQEIAAESGIAEPYVIVNTEQLALEGYLVDGNVILLYAIAAFLTLVIMAASVIVIANAFTISAGERVGQFGILKSAGATREQIRLSVLFEGAVLSLVGIPLGLLFGFGILLAGVALVGFFTRDFSALTASMLHFRLLFSPVALAVSTAVSLLTVLLSVWFPARRASKLSAIDAIRQTAEVRIQAKTLKTSRLTGRLFGFEGTLAAKNLKRSRRKYRATVISLVTSIVLVIVSTSFGAMLMASLNSVYPNLGVTASVDFDYGGITAQQAREYYAALDGYQAASLSGDAPQGDNPNGESPPAAKLSMGGNRYIDVELPEGFLSEQAASYLSGARVSLIVFDDANYARLCKASGAKTGDALVVNHLQLDRKTRLLPFDNWRQTLTLFDGEREYSLGLSAEIRDPDALLSAFCGRGSLVNVVVPLSTIEDWGLTMGASFLSDTRDASGFLDFASLQMAGAGAPNYKLNNRVAQAAATDNLYMLVMVFVYGFVGLLSLIAVSSVISTISTNIQLRSREFAALASTGMTPHGLRRMLNLESLLYGLKSIAIGIPLGLALSGALYALFGELAYFPFAVPWASMGICGVGVFIITFVSMRYASNKVRGESIIETMRAVGI